MQNGNRGMPALPASQDDAVEPQVNEQAPEVQKIPGDASNVVVGEAKGIKVFALHPGTYGNSRRVTDEKFEISSMKHIGNWMSLQDPKAEAERRKRQAAEKAAKKNAGSKL